MAEFMSIGGLCRELGISLSTAYRWIKVGRIALAFRTSGGHRRISRREADKVTGQSVERPLRVVTYSRMSSVDQRNNLEVQSQKLKRCVRSNIQVVPTCISQTWARG
jgi:excisionase family DNA binding protein